MIKERLHPNSEAATGLIAALIANIGAFHKEVSRLYGDVGRLHGKIKATHRGVDRLHRKIEGTHARIRVLRSQNRVQRRTRSRPVSASQQQATVESD
jgi:septal ring factor EnvC (AmiA/AmiB activator)